MNRRNFLRGLFGVAAAAAVAPVMKFVPGQAAPGAQAGVPVPHKTGSPTRLQQIYYDRVAVENFHANTPFRAMCSVRPLPKRGDLRTSPYFCRRMYLSADDLKKL